MKSLNYFLLGLSLFTVITSCQPNEYKACERIAKHGGTVLKTDPLVYLQDSTIYVSHSYSRRATVESVFDMNTPFDIKMPYVIWDKNGISVRDSILVNDVPFGDLVREFDIILSEFGCQPEHGRIHDEYNEPVISFRWTKEDHSFDPMEFNFYMTNYGLYYEESVPSLSTICGGESGRVCQVLLPGYFHVFEDIWIDFKIPVIFDERHEIADYNRTLYFEGWKDIEFTEFDIDTYYEIGHEYLTKLQEDAVSRILSITAIPELGIY